MGGIGIGLIGLGRHGMRYAQHVREEAPRARLIAVSRQDVQQGTAFATQHGLRFYRDYRELIADSEVGAVIAVVPPSLTSSICLEAVRARKPMLIEKPLALSAPVARMMAETVESAGVPLMTAHTLRFDTTIQALLQAIVDAGSCRHLTLTYRLEPPSAQKMVSPPKEDILYEIGTHLFDLVRILTHDEITEVRCDLASSLMNTRESRANVFLRTGRNVSCLLEISRTGTQRVSRIEWIGAQGQISADWVQGRLRCIGRPSDTREWTVKPCRTVVETLRAFLGALERGTPMPITGWDGYKSVAVADACVASAATGKSISVPS